MSVLLRCPVRTAPLFVGLWLALCAGPLAAQPTAEQQSAIRSNCRSDFMSNCSGVQPGGVEALQCLQRNVAKLSPGCRSAVNALNPRPPQAATAPAPAPVAAPPAAPAAAPSQPATASKPPAAARPSSASRQSAPPRRAAPATNPAPTSAAAPPVMPTAEQQSAIRFTCRRDFVANCRGVQPGGPEALACLQRNATKLSQNCRTAVAAVGDGAPVGSATSAPAAAAAPEGRPAGPLRRAIRERMMNR
jgi:hypothetical protein